MYKISGDEMLSFLQKDSVKNYYACCNLAKAGSKGYGVTKLDYYLRGEGDFGEYAAFTENFYGDLILETNAADTVFQSDALERVRVIFGGYKAVLINAAHRELFDSVEFTSRFAVDTAFRHNREYVVYGIYSEAGLITAPPPENVSVDVYKGGEAAEFETYDGDEWQWLGSMVKHGGVGDLLFILSCGGVCGYLYANRDFMNIYDIANIFVRPEYRGRRFGAILTSAFAKYCFAGGFIPHYGTATTKYSEAVAQACGFTVTNRTYSAKILLKR